MTHMVGDFCFFWGFYSSTRR